MPLHPDRYWWLVPGSLFVAFLWQYWPLDAAMRRFAPDAILLASIYWIMRKPHRFGSLTAFTVGLFRDGIDGAPLGQHALSMVLACYAVHLLHQRLRLFTVWQQGLVIAGITAFYIAVCNWIYLLDKPAGSDSLMLMPALVTGLCWPPALLLLRLLERRHLRQFPSRA